MSTENRSSNTEQMVSVLAPFAAVADMYDEAEDDDFEPWTDSAMHKDLRLTLGQFRQLRALLAQPAAQHQGEPIGEVVADHRGDFAVQLYYGPVNNATVNVGDKIYRHPPTSDGFSAGDMADQGAKAFREGQRAVIPEGFALVPKEMLLSKEVIGVINFHCGDTAEEEGGQFGRYTDGRLWVGNVTDDDGNQVHGLHIMTDEYPEEGSTTLVEFAPSSCTLPE